jgi:hypothetical protein
MTDENANTADLTIDEKLNQVLRKLGDLDAGDRADRRQPQQQDLPFAELPGLLEGRGAQSRTVQDRGRSAGGRV